MAARDSATLVPDLPLALPVPLGSSGADYYEAITGAPDFLYKLTLT